MNNVTYAQVIAAKFDAGVYREFLEQHYGQVLAYGGIGSTMGRALRHVKAISRISGIDRDTIIKSAQQYAETEL